MIKMNGRDEILFQAELSEIVPILKLKICRVLRIDSHRPVHPHLQYMDEFVKNERCNLPFGIILPGKSFNGELKATGNLRVVNVEKFLK